MPTDSIHDKVASLRVLALVNEQGHLPLHSSPLHFPHFPGFLDSQGHRLLDSVHSLYSVLNLREDPVEDF